MNDQHDVATQKLSEVAGHYLDRIISAAKQKVDQKIAARLANFDTYLEKAYNRCSQVRVMIDRDRPYPIEEIYVKGRFVSSDILIDDDYILSGLLESKKIVVEGFGGIGKTMLMKSLWMKIFKGNSGVVPIFVELRRINDLNNKSLIPYIRAFISRDNGIISDDTFIELLNSGRFVFLFDGFDELHDENRRELGSQITSLAYNYPKNGVIVSSRAGEQFLSWSQFELLHALPFKKDQIVEVISKIKFDQKVKKAFLSDVVGHRYDYYESFLSTPLLALMMLLTFDQFAEVPEKVHIFYRYAFQTLYSLHDASKESFQRRRKTGLNEDDFCKVFSFFCLMSYKDGSYSFSQEKIENYVQAAARRAGIVVDVKVFVAELMESVNLIYQEGPHYSFVHRSFQEYFCAYCMIYYFQGKISELIERIPSRPGDTVLSMLFEMNPDLVEDGFIIPRYEIYSEEIDSVLVRESDKIDLISKLKVVLMFFGGVHEETRRMHFGGAFYMTQLKPWRYMNLVRLMRPKEFIDPDVSLFEVHKSFRYIVSHIAKIPDIEFSENCGIELIIASKKCVLFHETFDGDYRRKDVQIELPDSIWQRILSQRSLRSHVEYASSMKASFVSLSRIVAAARKRQAQRRELDDRIFEI